MIIYKGRQIIAHSNEGNTDYLLVTFSPLYSEDDAAGHYYLQPQVEQANISCIGVMTTERGFFLSGEMDEVARLVRIARRGRKVIVFGQSMGGYAALKHSALLEADYVIASSPYFSLDPDELDLKSDRERRILLHQMSRHGVAQRPEFKGMGIRSSDVRGRLVVLYDPSERVDAHDVELIRRHLPEVELAPAWHAGHVIYDPAWEMVMVVGLLQAVQADHPKAVLHEMIRLRRSHPILIMRSAIKAIYRKPSLSARALRSRRVTQHPSARPMILSTINLRLIHILIARGARAEAQRHFEFFLNETLGADHAPLTRRDGDATSYLLLSSHGSFLVLDAVRQAVRFEPHAFGFVGLYPVIVRMVNSNLAFFALTEAGEIDVPPEAWMVERDVVMFPPAVVAHGAYRVGLRTGDAYFGAALTGGLHTHVRIEKQESFAAVAVDTGGAMIAADAPNLFEPIRAAPTAQVEVGEPVLVRLEKLQALVDSQDRRLASVASRLDRIDAKSAELIEMMSDVLQHREMDGMMSSGLAGRGSLGGGKSGGESPLI